MALFLVSIWKKRNRLLTSTPLEAQEWDLWLLSWRRKISWTEISWKEQLLEQWSHETHSSTQKILRLENLQTSVKCYASWLYTGLMMYELGSCTKTELPADTHQLLWKHLKEDHQEALIFQVGEKIAKIMNSLSNKKLREQNSYADSCINWNQEVLKRDLVLT